MLKMQTRFVKGHLKKNKRLSYVAPPLNIDANTKSLTVIAMFGVGVMRLMRGDVWCDATLRPR